MDSYIDMKALQGRPGPIAKRLQQAYREELETWLAGAGAESAGRTAANAS